MVAYAYHKNQNKPVSRLQQKVEWIEGLEDTLYSMQHNLTVQQTRDLLDTLCTIKLNIISASIQENMKWFFDHGIEPVFD